MLRTILAGILALASARGATEATAHLGRGNELMHAEKYEEAASEFSAAVHADQGLREARLNLAICDFQLRKYEDARGLFSALAANGPPSLATYYLGRIDMFEGKLDSAIERFRSLLRAGEVSDEKYYLGVALFEKKKYAEAADLLRQRIAGNPRDFRAHQRLARCLQMLGRPQEAAQEFARTRELHVYYTEGSIALAACENLLRTGTGDQAWAQCRTLGDTDDVDKLVALGIVLGRHGDAVHAREIWEKALALDPDSPEINYNLGLSCFELRDMRCGRDYANRAVSLWPDFPEANVLYGTILYMLADDAAAKRVLEHARELRPGDEMVQRLLKELHSGKPGAAAIPQK